MYTTALSALGLRCGWTKIDHVTRSGSPRQT